MRAKPQIDDQTLEGGCPGRQHAAQRSATQGITHRQHTTHAPPKQKSLSRPRCALFPSIPPIYVFFFRSFLFWYFFFFPRFREASKQAGSVGQPSITHPFTMRTGNFSRTPPFLSPDPQNKH